jgi:hypothetical protein
VDTQAPGRKYGNVRTTIGTEHSSVSQNFAERNLLIGPNVQQGEKKGNKYSSSNV